MEPLRQWGVGDQHDCPEREKLLYKRKFKIAFLNLIERNVMEKIEMMDLVRIDLIV